jgi:transposase
MKAMAKHRTHSIEFKRQIARDVIARDAVSAGESTKRLARIERSSFKLPHPDSDEVTSEAQAADLFQDYEAKIAALERMVGRQALEIEFRKGALKSAPRPRSASTSVITGPVASPSPKDAG